MPRSRGRGAEYFAPPLPRLIAHRGFAVSAAENTLQAFRAALEAGATHLELDVQMTRDGEVIVLHDPSLARVLGRGGSLPRVAQATLAEVRAHADPQLSVCTLVELLRALPDARLNIDVKAASAADATGRIIAAEGAAPRVLLTSFDSRRRRGALRHAVGAATSASVTGVVLAVVAAHLGIGPLVRAVLSGVDAVQIPRRIAGIRTTTPRMVRRLHRAGVEVHVWTVDDPADMERLLDAGVDGIVTDRIDLLRDVAARRRTAPRADDHPATLLP